MKKVRRPLKNPFFTAFGPASLMIALWTGCAGSEVKPVDIFPEDNCAQCRMAISEKEFASEMITQESDVFKFDDLGCLENYRKNNPAVQPKAVFVTDYDSKTWIPYEGSVIVKTDVATPMGSGKVAFADSARATAFAAEHPAKTISESNGCACCSTGS